MPCISARYMLVGVFPQRDGAIRTTSAFSMARTDWPSSCSIANSTACMRRLYRCESPTPCRRAGAWSPTCPSCASSWERCPLTKSMTGAFVHQQLLAHRLVDHGEEHQWGDVAIHRSIEVRPRTSRASSTVRTKGISRRSKGMEGNCSSRALPMVSALIPVESEMKKTGTAVEATGGSRRRRAAVAGSEDLRSQGAPCSGPDGGAPGTRRCAGLTVAGRTGAGHPHPRRWCGSPPQQ